MGDAAPKGMMKAAVIREYGGKITVENVPKPVPGPRELLVRVKAASLCHSDVGIIKGNFGRFNLPLVIGHEGLGQVEALGEQAMTYGFKVGDMVGDALWHGMCLECIPCRDAGPQFCPKRLTKGMNMAGCFAEYMLMDAASAVVINLNESPDSSAILRQLAPVFCAGITVFDAVERAKIAPGETVAVVGAGGLGQVCIQYASALGAKVIAFDVRDEQLESCRGQGGADKIVNIIKAGEELVNTLKSLNSGRLADVVIVTSGAGAAYQTAFTLLAPLARLIAVGMPHEPIQIPTRVFINGCQSVIGAKVPGQKGIQRCLDFTLRKKILPKVHPRKFALEDLNEMVELMEAGEIEKGRMVVEFF
ncbi:chaperonin 10-like protein [Xylogone sp. PMI_703]|nr:chaperonin 10-like protein [Xylogone sp. PMI_703]